MKENADNLQENIDELSKELKAHPNNADLLVKRADIYYKTNHLGKALNDLRKAIKTNPESKEIKTKIETIEQILRSKALDIYASTNLNNDPWFE